jgi:hypothetical protein
MNLKAIVIATIIGLSGSAIADIALNTHAVAQPNANGGTFADGEWQVVIGKNGDDFSYYGVNLKTGDRITLRGATVSGNSQRQIYTWTNGNVRYQVVWQPSDPEVIRLQVFDGTGRELLNRLLYQG